jgi:hypothetical protein
MKFVYGIFTLHEYVSAHAQALQRAGTSISEMQAILHTVHSDC